jgi:hypothetical protein
MRALRSSTSLSVGAALGAVACTGCATGESTFHLRTTFDAAHSPMSLAQLARYQRFPVYWVGMRFRRWPLIDIQPPADRNDFMTLTYGDCRPVGGDEPSCVPPIAIQLFPVCDNLSSVSTGGARGTASIRGAPVGGIDNAPVLITRRVQVKVYAPSLAIALAVLHRLRSANRVAPVIGVHGRIPTVPLSVFDGNAPCR